MLKIKRSLFIKLALLILLSTSLVLLMVIRINSQNMRHELTYNQQAYYTALASASAKEIELFFLDASQTVDAAVSRFSAQNLTARRAIRLMNDILTSNEAIHASAVALTPEMSTEGDFQIIYSCHDGDQIETTLRTNPAKDYQKDWFQLPYHLKRGVWNDVYFDDTANEMMITYSAPVIRQDRVIAVIICDLSLNRIQDLFEKLQFGGGTKAILLSRFGRVLAHPNTDWVMTETLYSLNEGTRNPESRHYLAQLRALTNRNEPNSRKCDHTLDSGAAWIYCEPIPSTSWNIAFVVPEEHILAPIRAMNWKLCYSAALGMLLLLIPALLVSLTITRPLRLLCLAAEDLADGKFDTPLPSIGKNPDEIGRMVHSFDSMRINLKEYIANLANTTAAKEKIESELSIACEIQHSILPKLFPPFPKRAGLDIFASLESAREVGGDLYDFALLDDDHLYFCIGDVSGKGVPASLFMAVGKTLLKSTIQGLRDPAQALTHVNNELAEGNDTCMFITLFCGILDFNTNQITYSNAGHNPPVSINHDQPAFLPPSQSPPLGAMEDMSFINETLQLDEGEQLLLYTDGVTEAMNGQQELFGEQRLLELLTNNPSRTAEKRIVTVNHAIQLHAGSAEQSDDITMLCLAHSRHEDISSDDKSPTSSLILTNHREEFARMVTWIEEMATKLNWEPALVMSLNLALEEWIVNVVSYAFPDGDIHEIELRLWQSEKAVKMEIIDDGIPFDPTIQRAPDLDIPIEEREIGGLGIHFIHNTMDEFTYTRANGQNIVAMKKLLSTKDD